MKLFIVTGISSGLGEKISEELIEKKEKMIGIGRRFTNLQEQYTYQNPSISSLIKCDFSNSLEVNNLIKELGSIPLKDYAKIIFINNAGVIGPIAKIGEFDNFGDIEEHVYINYLTPLLITNALVKLKSEKTVLEVINISSGAAENMIEGWSLYCSTKKAIKTFFDVLNKEHKEDIVIKHIDPGVIDTNMQKVIRATSIEQFPLVKQFIGYEENGVLLTPDTVAKHILKGFI